MGLWDWFDLLAHHLSYDHLPVNQMISSPVYNDTDGKPEIAGGQAMEHGVGKEPELLKNPAYKTGDWNVDTPQVGLEVNGRPHAVNGFSLDSMPNRGLPPNDVNNKFGLQPSLGDWR